MNIGNGNHVYEVIEQWAQVPSHVKLAYTHGIEVDSEDNIYVFQTGTPSVIKFNKDGEFITAWGEQFEGGAHGFYLHKEADGDYFYVTDTSRGLMVKLTTEGDEVLTIGTPDLPNVYDSERKFVPTDVCVAPNGDIYVADGYGQSMVHQYDAKGTPIRSWGGKGSEPGQMSCPHGISINMRSSEPEVYVADRSNKRIQVFTLDGIHKRFVTDEMNMPCNFFFDGDEVYIPDLISRVSIFDANDHLIAHLGHDTEAKGQEGWPNLPLEYFQPGKFSSPHGICVDSQHNVYVAEWTQFGRITKLVRK